MYPGANNFFSEVETKRNILLSFKAVLLIRDPVLFNPLLPDPG
jgi:hypothetical protein